MPEKLTLDKIKQKIEEIKQWYPEANVDISTYTAFNNKIKVIDS